MSKGIRAVIVLIALVIGVMVIPAGAAFADAGANASCVGIESSAISPKGSSDELPGGRPQVNGILRDALGTHGIGAVIAQVAKIHAGSHEGCDAATG